MLQIESLVKVIDNTGATQAKIIGRLGTMERQVSIGDVVNVSIQRSSATSSIEPGQIFKAVIVRVRKEVGRKDGSYIKFGDNAVVLMDVDNKGEIKPIGKRVFGPLPRELREKYKSITSLAPEII